MRTRHTMTRSRHGRRSLTFAQVSFSQGTLSPTQELVQLLRHRIGLTAQENWNVRGGFRRRGLDCHGQRSVLKLKRKQRRCLQGVSGQPPSGGIGLTICAGCSASLVVTLATILFLRDFYARGYTAKERAKSYSGAFDSYGYLDS